MTMYLAVYYICNNIEMLRTIKYCLLSKSSVLDQRAWLDHANEWDKFA